MSTNQLKLWNDTQPTLLINSGKLLKNHQSARKKAKTVSQKHHECPSKFKVIPKRWIVERSFAWLEKFRRLTIDYEYHADTAETMVQLAFCKIMLNKFIE